MGVFCPGRPSVSSKELGEIVIVFVNENASVVPLRAELKFV